jgi:hypothetical protein
VVSRRSRGVCSLSVVDFKVRELNLHSNSGSTLNLTKAGQLGNTICGVSHRGVWNFGRNLIQ